MVIVHELAYLVSLCLRFFICKTGLIIAPTSQDHCKSSVMHSAGDFAISDVWLALIARVQQLTTQMKSLALRKRSF